MYLFDVSEIIRTVPLIEKVSDYDKTLIAFTADVGERFKEYGINRFDVLIFDRMKDAEPGKLSVYACKDKSGTTVFRLSDVPLTGFCHIGKYVYNYSTREAA